MKNKSRIYSTGLASIALVLFLILISSAAIAASLTPTETQITTGDDELWASDPAIDGNRIAYTSASDSESDYWVG
ncbi:MAG: hypothetical protein WCB90_10095, partial [Methanosarcina sp.]